MRFAFLLSSGFITAIVVNPPEKKLAKRTSVDCLTQASFGTMKNEDVRMILIYYTYYYWTYYIQLESPFENRLEIADKREIKFDKPTHAR